MCNNALSRLFDKSINQASPVRDDFVQVKKVDEDGNIFTIYQKFDYPSFQLSLGTVDSWQLNNLLSAGINPNFPIHTGNPTRLEGMSVVNDAVRIAEEFSVDVPKNEE